MIIYNEIIQNSPEWFQIKLGKFSSSRAVDLLRKENSESYKNLIKKLAYEKVTNETAEDFAGNQYTERGHEFEDQARLDYEFNFNLQTELVGFVELNEFVGTSPDAFVNDNGLLEIKCLGYKAHIDILSSKKPENNHITQCQFHLFVTKKEWCDLYYYHPKLKSYNFRILPDLERFKEFEERIKQGILDVENLINKLNKE